MQIELKHVSYTYLPGTPHQALGLDDISLSFREGEYTAVVGQTGSGKSTLVQHLNGLIRPDSGQVLLDGRDIHEKSFQMKELRSKVGLVFQYPETQLFEETVEKDIGFGPRNMGLTDGEIRERILESVRMVGLSESSLSESPFELSGGNMRRCALAGILAMRPRILVLDEPTAGLDPFGKESVLQLIAGLHQSGIGIVMVTHNMDDAAQYAQRIIMMNRGRIVIDDTPERAFEHEDRLIAMGLELPSIALLGDALRSRGIDFPHGILKKEDALDWLQDTLKTRKQTENDE